MENVLLLWRNRSVKLTAIFALKFLESVADFSLSLNLVLYLSAAHGFTDASASSVYATWGLIIGIVVMASGPVIDRMGISTSLAIGACANALGRVLFLSGNTKVALIGLLIFQPIGMAFCIPVLSIALRREVPVATQPVAFGVFYTVMNVAALVSALLTDALNAEFRANLEISLFVLFCLATACTFVYVYLAFSWPKDTAPIHNGSDSLWFQVRETLRDPVFPRLVAFSFFLLGSRAVFRHMDTTFPKWALRRIGSDAPYGLLYAVNPVLVITLTTFIQGWLTDVDDFLVILIGTVLCAAAPFVLAIQEASMSAAILFVILLTFGEIVQTPKLQQFSMAVAPLGKEGVYSTLASIPLFGVRFVSGLFSGELLQKYCHGPPWQCRTMWALIGTTALTTPLAMIAGHKWLYSETIRTRLREASGKTPHPPEA